ncbi:MAG TPA: LacI family DNA-binding transcriptional regulator [Opitutaceae bacterium]|nr:LacI family DNA-binding transcriptional regulator [Opitutaceae bacterium]
MPLPFPAKAASRNRRRRVTLRDVATSAGVSIMTVSLALRHRPAVAKATAERVQEIARRLGYVPDPALSALAHYRNHVRPSRGFATIALLTDWNGANDWLDSKVGRVAFEGAASRAHDFGYRLEHFWLGPSGQGAARVGDILYHRGIQGVILAPIMGTIAAIRFPWERFAVVTLERFPDFPHFFHVSPNHYADLMLAWDRLLERGYRRIGLMVPAALAERGRHRWEAAHLVQQRLNARRAERVPTLLVEEDETDPPAVIARWLRTRRPDVVISPAAEYRSAIQAAGWSIPGDVAYASLQTQMDVPGVSGINQRREEMGAACINALNTMVQHKEFGAFPYLAGTMLDGEWVDGGTAPSRRG